MKLRLMRAVGDAVAPCAAALIVALHAIGPVLANDALAGASPESLGSVDVHVNETAPDKQGFQYNDNTHLASTQEMISSAAATSSRACLLIAECDQDKGAGDIIFGAQSMKHFAGIQTVGQNTGQGGNAQAQTAVVAHAPIHLNARP